MLSKASVKKPLTVVVGIILIIILGVVSVMNTGVDLLPGMNMPYMMVITVFPGAAPETVEKDITSPIEKSISTVSSIDRIKSTSSEHVSIITLELNSSANIDTVFQEITASLKLVTLPKSDLLQDPIVMKLDPSMLPIMSLSIGRDGHSIQDSGDYFNEIIAKINAIDGVANVGSNGLVSNLAYVGLDPAKTSKYISEFLFDLLDLDVTIPPETKEQIRVYLRDLVKEAEHDPSLITDGEIDPEKLLDRIIKDIEGSDLDLGNSAILGQILEQLKIKDSVLRKAAISSIKTVLDNRYMLEDGEENKKVFNAILDQLADSAITGVAGTFVGDLTSKISADIFKQLIFAQNFDMPAGSLPVGEAGYIVKIGDAIKNREELYNLPIVTISLSQFIQKYLAQFETILNIAGLISPDGTATFTDDNLKQIAQAIATITDNVTDYGQWSVDLLTQNASPEFAINNEAKAAWVKLLNDNTGFKALTNGFTENRPTDWRKQTLNYIKANGLYPIGQVIVTPAFWTDGATGADGVATPDYNVFYASKISDQINALTRFSPTTPTAYATSVVNDLSTNTQNVLFPIDAVGRTAWIDLLVLNEKFVSICETLTIESNWKYTLLEFIKTTAQDEVLSGATLSTVFPKGKIMSQGRDLVNVGDDRIWDDAYTTTFLGISGTVDSLGIIPQKLKAIVDDRPLKTDYKAFADYVAKNLAETNAGSAFYLSPIAIDNWARWLASNTNFKALVNGITSPDGINESYKYDWRITILNAMKADSDSKKYSYFPVNERIRPEQLWDASVSQYYDTKVNTEIVNTDVLLTMANAIKAAIGDEAYNSLLQLFAGKNADEIFSDLKSMLKLASDLSPNGVKITVDENGLSTYVVDFKALNTDLKNAEELLKLPLFMNSLGDISFLNDSGKQISTIYTKDKDGNFVAGTSVSITIEKEPDKSTANITGDIRKLLEQLEKEDPNFTYSVLSDDGEFINQMLSSVVINLLWGALFAAIVLLFFLKRIMPTLVVASSIVLSVVAAFVCMYFCGITLNVISMGGMTLAVGMLVDNSIVVLENIYRMKAQGKNIYAAAIQGSKQVGTAIIASTVTTIVVFLPVIFIDGITKEIMKDMSLTITFALLASLIAALTVVPVAASTILREKAKPDGKVIKTVKKGYTKMLNFSLNNKIVVIPIVLVLFCSSLVVAFFMNREFIPPMDTGTLVVTCTVNRERINEINGDTDVFSEKYYTYQDGVNDTVKSVVGTAKQFNDVQTFGVSYSSGMSLGGLSIASGDPSIAITILLKEKRELSFEDLQRDIADAVKSNSRGLFNSSVSTNSLLETGGMSGNSKEILIFGEDFDELREQTLLITDKIRALDGVLTVNNGFSAANKEYKITVDKKKASAMGLTVAQVYLQVQKHLAQPGVLETLRLTNPDDITNNTKDYVDIFVYSNNYQVNTWYEGYKNNVGDISSRIYFTNNLVNSGDKKNNNDYFVINNSLDSVIIKQTNAPDAIPMMVEAGGRIPLSCDGDNYSYYLAKPTEKEVINTDGTKTTVTEINYELVSYTVRSYMQYSSVKQKPIDLMTLDIKSENMLDPTAPITTAPLFSLLTDDSFVKDSDGNVIYRGETTATGDKIPQGAIMKDGYSSISHFQKDKCITVKVTYDSNIVSDKDLGKAISRIIDEYNLTKPSGVRISADGTSTLMNEVFTTLIGVLILAIVLIYLIMVAQFQSLKSPFIIMFTIPLAFTGGILLLWMTGQKLSIIALIGLIILMGVVVNNGIVFVDYANKLIESGVPKREAMLRTGIDRLRPIFMTALTTIFATLTMAFDNSSVGKMLQPLAITTIGGLTYATFLTLIFVPIMYELFNKNAKPSNRTLAFRDAEIDKIDGQEIDDNLTEDVQALIKMVENDTFRLTRVIRKDRHSNYEAVEMADLAENEIDIINSDSLEDGEHNDISPYERQKLKNRGLLNESEDESDYGVDEIVDGELHSDEITSDDITKTDA